MVLLFYAVHKDRIADDGNRLVGIEPEIVDIFGLVVGALGAHEEGGGNRQPAV